MKMRRLVLAGIACVFGCAQGAYAQQPAASLQRPYPAASSTGAARFNDSRIQTTTNRAPASTDGTNIPLSPGASWMANGKTYQLQDATSGGALWAPVSDDALPLDTVGLYVNSATVAAGGSGYAVGNTIEMTGGVVLTVATLGSGTSVGTVTVTNPYMMACAPTGAVGQAYSSGGGTGATFNLSLAYPFAYGTRKLTRCYSGNAFTAFRSDTFETKSIGFLADGSLDTQTFDGFSAGPAPMSSFITYNSGVLAYVNSWNDQGGSGQNATGSSGLPGLYPNRMIGDSRSMMFYGKAGNTTWTPQTTSLTLPSGVTVTPNNMTLAVLGGMESTTLGDPGFINLGSNTGAVSAGLEISQYNPWFNCSNGAGTPNPGWIPTDTPMLAVCVVNNSGVTFDIGNRSITGGTGGNSSPQSGGLLGCGPNTAASSPVVCAGEVDMAAAIIIPWALPAQTRLNFEASLYRTFNVPPQYSAMIAAVGDSHMDGYGTPFQDSWPREMIRSMNRNDISLTNAAYAGAQMAGLIGSGWGEYVAPNLAAYNGPKFVMLQGGYNDFGAGQTLAQVTASYQAAVGLAHASSAKAVCVADVIRSASLAVNQNMQTLAAEMRSGVIPCDAIIDFQQFAPFNQAAGPWPSPWFEPQDDLHLTSYGNAVCGEIAAIDMNSLLP